MHARTRPTLYESLEALPEGLTGEILDGQLYAHPRPTAAHGLAAISLADELVSPFQKGRGGPGGWWIIAEPELHFIQDTEVDVPDLAGWRRQRMPTLPEGHRFTVVPDWVCEILSKTSESTDRLATRKEKGPRKRSKRGQTKFLSALTPGCSTLAPYSRLIPLERRAHPTDSCGKFGG